jgi:serine/threonine-protein kinase
MAYDEFSSGARRAGAPDDEFLVAGELFDEGETNDGRVSGQRATTLRPSPRNHSAWNDATVSEGEVLAHRYRVEQCLGRTGHELVVIARHTELGQRVVLRYLSYDAMETPEVVLSFQRAARKAFELRSQHAERVMDFGRLESGNPYRVAELPRGPSLDEVLNVRGPLPIDEAVDLVITAAEAVAEAHAVRLVYKNLGTSNIFVDRRSDGSPLVRVVDFGVLDAIDSDILRGYELTVPGASSMTRALPYIAPEQIRTPSAVDHRADIWGLGCILYELLAGHRAFQADSSIPLLAMIVAEAPPSLASLRDDIPKELSDAVSACLRKNPAARPQSVGELVCALACFASPEIRAAAARIGQISSRSSRPSMASHHHDTSTQPWAPPEIIPLAPPRSSRPVPQHPPSEDRWTSSAPGESRSPPPPVGQQATAPSGPAAGPQPAGRVVLIALGGAIGVASALVLALLLRTGPTLTPDVQPRSETQVAASPPMSDRVATARDPEPKRSVASGASVGHFLQPSNEERLKRPPAADRAESKRGDAQLSAGATGPGSKRTAPTEAPSSPSEVQSSTGSDDAPRKASTPEELFGSIE